MQNNLGSILGKSFYYEPVFLVLLVWLLLVWELQVTE